MKRENKLKIVISICAAIVGVAALAESILFMPYLPRVLGIVNLITGIAVFVLTLSVAVKEDYSAGDYECRCCGEHFKPTFKAYFWGAHTATRRNLKCPHCGKKSFCKRRLD